MMRNSEARKRLEAQQAKAWWGMEFGRIPAQLAAEHGELIQQWFHPAEPVTRYVFPPVSEFREGNPE